MEVAIDDGGAAAMMVGAAMVGAVRGAAATKAGRLVAMAAMAVGTVARAVRAGVVLLLCTARFQ